MAAAGAESPGTESGVQVDSSVALLDLAGAVWSPLGSPASGMEGATPFDRG